jgi:hypothetical protein
MGLNVTLNHISGIYIVIVLLLDESKEQGFEPIELLQQYADKISQ